MTEFQNSIRANSPYHMVIYHVEGTADKPHNAMPIAKKKGIPNLTWAMGTILNYRIGKVRKVLFYKDKTQLFGTYENGRYFGEFQDYEDILSGNKVIIR